MKVCTLCRAPLTLNALLTSADIRPIGMAFEPGDFANNCYYFNHECPGCGTTLLVPVERFLHLIPEDIPEAVLDGTEHCERHCRRVKDLKACHQPCHYAPFRRFLLDRLIQRRSN